MYGKKNTQWIINQIYKKQAANKQELTNWDNILITENKDCITNFEIPPADYLTKKFSLTPLEGSRATPMRNSNSKVGHGLTMMSLKALPI